MECFEVTGGTALTGRVRVTGAKNSALKLMAAALLAAGPTTIEEVPDILDVSIMSEVLRRLGCDVSYERTGNGGGGGRVVVDVPEKPSTETDYDLVRKMRASISVLGPLVGRCGTARVALPGGDAIGSRVLAMHISQLPRPSWRRGRPSSTTRPANRRSWTCATCSVPWVPASTAPAPSRSPWRASTRS